MGELKSELFPVGGEHLLKRKKEKQNRSSPPSASDDLGVITLHKLSIIRYVEKLHRLMYAETVGVHLHMW